MSGIRQVIAVATLITVLSGCGSQSPSETGMAVQTRTFPANSPEMAEILSSIDQLCKSGQDTFRRPCLFSVVPSLDGSVVTVTWVGPADE